MYKLYYKFKKYINKKGFTLVELLAVIVILAIIMIIAIPAILDSLDNAKKKSFETYTSRILALADQETMKREMNGNSFGEQCFVYNKTKDFELNNTGDYKGYVLLQVSANAKKYYVTMWSSDYMLISYNITENIDYSGKKKSIQDALERYDSNREDELTIQSLCNYACSSCTYENNGENKTINGDITKVKGATTLVRGKDIKNKFLTLAGDEPIVNIKRSYELPEDKTKVTISINNDQSSIDNPVYAWFDTDTIYFYTNATQIFLNEECISLFNGFKNLKDIKDFVNSTKTNKVKYASSIFDGDTSLEELDLSNWTFENAIEMHHMFSNCSGLLNLNISNFKTNNVRDMGYMFQSCSLLKELNISHFDTSNVTTMVNLFLNCKSLKNLDVSNWNVSNVNDMRKTFANCSALESLDVSKWNVSNVIQTHSYELGLFSGCSSLTEIDLSNWNVKKMESAASMFAECKNLKIIDLSNWDTSNIQNFQFMFSNCRSLEDLRINNWNLKSATKLEAMFRLAFVHLDKLDFSNCNANNVISMNRMFEGTRIDYVDLRGINTENVTSFYYLFTATKIKVLDLSTWDNSKVTAYGRMFFDSSELEHVYIGSKWTTKNYALPDTAEMFRYNKKLRNWDGTNDHTKAHAGDDGYFELK